jgi:hypothetical protein
MSSTRKEQNMTMRLMITTALVLAAAYGPALAGDRNTSKRGPYAFTMQMAIGGFNRAPAIVRGGGLNSYPTDYLTNRFGDRQLQGR